jgi:hypothetical protein
MITASTLTRQPRPDQPVATWQREAARGNPAAAAKTVLAHAASTTAWDALHSDETPG